LLLNVRPSKIGLVELIAVPDTVLSDCFAFVTAPSARSAVATAPAAIVGFG
jgi:hypothetical protein